MRKIAIIVLCGVLFNFTIHMNSQPTYTDIAPEMYYYSIDDNAFVMERADGSQRRILAQYTIPERDIVISEGAGYIMGSGWSWSSTWFSWFTLGRNGTSASEVFITSRDSEVVIELALGQVIQNTLWSPTSEQLLVHALASYEEDAEETISIYEPDQNAFSLELRVSDVLTQGRIRWLGWSSDGTTIAFANRMQISVFDVETGSIISVIDNATIPIRDCNLSIPYWINASQLVFAYSDGTQLYNLTLGSDGDPDISNFSNGEIVFADWSEGNLYATVYVTSTTGSHDLWLYSSETGETTHIEENVDFINGCGILYDSILWSADNLVIYVQNGKLIYYDVNTQESVIISLSDEMSLANNSPIRWYENSIIFLADQLETGTRYLLQYHIETNSLSDITPIRDSQIIPIYSTYFSSPAQNHILYQDVLMNLATGNNSRIWDSSGYSTVFDAWDVRWDRTNSWLISASFSFENLYRVFVNHIDGDAQRQVTTCPLYSMTCFGWMP